LEYTLELLLGLYVFVRRLSELVVISVLINHVIILWLRLTDNLTNKKYILIALKPLVL